MYKPTPIFMHDQHTTERRRWLTEYQRNLTRLAAYFQRAARSRA